MMNDVKLHSEILDYSEPAGLVAVAFFCLAHLDIRALDTRSFIPLISWLFISRIASDAPYKHTQTSVTLIVAFQKCRTSQH